MLRILVIMSVLAVGGCSRADESAFRLTNGVHEVMEHVLDPAADVVWGASGYVITEAGEEDLSPKTDEEWMAVENAAAVVAESGNLLMLPGRAPQGEADWIRHSQAMTEAGLKAMKAAEAKNKQGVFDTGGEIYQTCLACHEQYITGE